MARENEAESHERPRLGRPSRATRSLPIRWPDPETPDLEASGIVLSSRLREIVRKAFESDGWPTARNVEWRVLDRSIPVPPPSAPNVAPETEADDEAENLLLPPAEEIRRAVDTLGRLAAHDRSTSWEEAVEGLLGSASLDPGQLYQAQQHASRRRWLMNTLNLVGPGAIAKLLPDRVGHDANAQRAVDRLRRTGALLAVPFKSGWRYPTEQISHTARVHDPIPELVRRARAVGHEPWEILYWLARPTERWEAPFVGRPVEHEDRSLSLDELFDAAGEHASGSDRVELGPCPFDLLASGDEEGFTAAARAWLGPDDD